MNKLIFVDLVLGIARYCRMRLLVAALIMSSVGQTSLAQTAPAPEGHAVITIYHHVSDTTPRSTSLTAEELRIQMEYLRDNNFEV